jgi:hypothetical protein
MGQPTAFRDRFTLAATVSLNQVARTAVVAVANFDTLKVSNPRPIAFA